MERATQQVHEGDRRRVGHVQLGLQDLDASREVPLVTIREDGCSPEGLTDR